MPVHSPFLLTSSVFSRCLGAAFRLVQIGRSDFIKRFLCSGIYPVSAEDSFFFLSTRLPASVSPCETFVRACCLQLYWSLQLFRSPSQLPAPSAFSQTGNKSWSEGMPARLYQPGKWWISLLRSLPQASCQKASRLYTLPTYAVPKPEICRKLVN